MSARMMAFHSATPLMLEREFGWTGLCIEPNPDVFPLLIENRSAVCPEITIAKRDGRLPFIKVDSCAQMLSGLSQSMDTRHRERIERETSDRTEASGLTLTSITEWDVFPKSTIS